MKTKLDFEAGMLITMLLYPFAVILFYLFFGLEQVVFMSACFMGVGLLVSMVLLVKTEGSCARTKPTKCAESEKQ